MNTQVSSKVKIIRAFGLKVWFIGNIFGDYKVMIAKCTDTGRFVSHARAVEVINRMVFCGKTAETREDMTRFVDRLYAKIKVLAIRANNTQKECDHAKVEVLLCQYNELVKGMTW